MKKEELRRGAKPYGHKIIIDLKKVIYAVIISIFIFILTNGNHLFAQSQTFTTSGTFTVPAGVTSITVECWGGGGAGGGSNSNWIRGGGGGAGGAYARSILAVTPGASYTVTVGSEAAGGLGNGSNGNPSWFGNASLVFAEGGEGGDAPNWGTAAGGNGSSSSSIGDVVYPGGDGGNGVFGSSYSGGGGGGAGSTGAGVDGVGISFGQGTANNGGDGGNGRNNEGDGNPGNTYGGGGGGAYVPDATNHVGGNGAAGLVMVTWTQPIFYSQGSVSPNILSNWNTNPVGGGYIPTNFSAVYQTFVVQSGHSMTTTAAWDISGTNTILRITNGSVLTENNNISLNATGTLEIENGGTLNHNVNSTNIFIGTEIIGPTSTISYGFAGAQNIIPAIYGNLSINNGSIKTLQGDITVRNILQLINGRISLGGASYNLNLADNATIAPAAFGPSLMIICDGTGSLIKESTTDTGFEMIFPVGEGLYYTPVEITNMSATIAGSGSISVNVDPTVADGPPPANATDLDRHWNISSSGLSSVNADLSFTYDDSDIGGDENIYEPAYFNSLWIKPSGSVNEANNNIIISSATNLDGEWTAREPVLTYYSYQSGDWAVAATWTTDPSGTLSVNPSVPDLDDRVVILNGRTVYTNADNLSVQSLQLNEGGTLDLKATTGHDFGDVMGMGWMRLNILNFPAGTFTNFVSADGGTIEYYDVTGQLAQTDYNNLLLRKTTNNGTNYTITLASDLTVNGNFTITRTQGTGTMTFTIGNNTTSRDITIAGDLTVNSGSAISTANFNTFHTLEIFGDFTNRGTVRFTNRTPPVTHNYLTTDPPNGVLVSFKGLSDNTLTCDNTTDFHRLVVDKGSDQTYVLTVNSANANYFRVFGRNDQQATDYAADPNNPNLQGILKNIWIRNGTLKLEGNIFIPSLTEGGGDNFQIPLNGCLWLNGANVHVDATWPDGATGNQTIVPFGKLRVDAGLLDFQNAAGLVYRGTAEIEINGGSIRASQFRPSSVTAEALSSFVITGGAFTIDGQGEINQPKAAFCLPFLTNTFVMTGGVININYASQSGGDGGALVIGCSPENINVTGGQININITNNNAYRVTSTAPFYNLNISKTGGTATGVSLESITSSGFAAPVVTTTTAQMPLIIQNNLTILTGNNPILLTNNADVYVGGNFTINTGTTYTPGTNTTYFNGTAGQLFNNNGTVTAGLYNLSITNRSNTSIAQNLTVLNNLSISDECFLQDMSRTVSVAGNITNSGTHISQAGGSIMLNGAVNQSVGGDGSGIFGNLIINKTGGLASFTTNQSLTGNLRLANGILNIGTYQLTLGTGSNVYDAIAGSGTAFSGAKMIRTAGNQSDGGVTKSFDFTGNFLFPIGTANDYTPATLGFNSAPDTWGSVNIKPVAHYHPFAAVTPTSLNYYWKVSGTGITGIAAGSVSHTYRYVTSDLRGTEANYIPGVYNPYGWTIIANPAAVLDPSNDILFANVNYISGDFTAGEPASFPLVKVFYSRQNGAWNNPNTWSSTAVGGPADGALPGANNPVIIGDGAGLNHTVTVPVNGITIGGLQINNGSVLDITTTTGHNFGAIPDTKVSGTGTLRISSSAGTATFPGGDFGNFLSDDGGTVEYYSTGAVNFTLPARPNYNNLILSPANGLTITMPNLDMIIYNDLTVTGTGTGIARLNSAAARTLTIDSNLIINSGTLRFMNNNNAQTVNIKNNINIAAGAVFDISTTTNATNILYIEGNLHNDGNFDMYGGAAARVCNVYFTGDENKVISGTGPSNEFNYLNVDKGTSRNTILDVTADNLTMVGTGTALILNNGTFRVSNPGLAFTLSTTSSFIIPISAALSVNQGEVTIGTNNNNGDLILAGRLEVINTGIVNIGDATPDINNDIIYASGGGPEIIVRDLAVLNVDGQIRRSLTITSGSLRFIQSGGTVTINGHVHSPTRAKFEILNSGSEFNMSGGSLIITNGGGDPNLFGDVLITPESYDVTGGTIQLGSGTTTGNNFSFNASSPIWNLTIDGTTTNKTADLRVNTLDIQNNLTINGNSIFRTNGLDVNIGGNLTNNNSSAAVGLTSGGYQTSTATQKTTFDGSAQSIAGAGANLTNFANVIISSSGTLNLASNSNLRINGNLTLNSGILADGGNVISVTGNIDNSATHTSSSLSGGLNLTGSQKQIVSGNGSGIFGNIILNNSLGIDMTDNSVINGQLTFTLGNLYIDDYLLTLGPDATISGTNDADHMIIINGVLSDAGVRKIFSSGAATFTFPIGVAGKYTPASYSFSSNPNNNAAITVKPINTSHPVDAAPAGNELAYYWNVVSTGFSSAFTVDQVFQYNDADVSGNEGLYYAGRFTGGNWVPVGGIAGTVNAVTDEISLTGLAYLDGEYTAGETANFVNKPTLYSRQTGNWSNPNSWSTTGHSGASCGCTPDGNPVIIGAAHTITLDSDGATAYSVDIQGTLDAGNTVFHNLGHVIGGGRIRLTSTSEGFFVFPGGYYEVFMNTPTSTIEFFGNNNASLPLKPGNDYKPYQHVIYSGTGTKNISADNIKVQGNLTIEAGATLSNELFNKNITIFGNWTDNSTSSTGGFIPGTGTVRFRGTNPQVLTITDAAATSQFYNFEIDNPADLTLSGNGDISLSRYLYLTSGNIITSSINLLTLSNTSPNSVIGGCPASFIDGPLQKSMLAGSYFNFPIGDGNRCGNLYVSQVSVTGNYIAEYYDHNPLNEGYDPDSKINPIDVVSNVEYWRLNGPGASTANVRVRWDDQSAVIPADAGSRTKLRIVEWDPAALPSPAWRNRGNVIYDGGVNSGTIQTNPAVAVNGNHFFTIGVESLPTALITSGDSSICDDGSTTSITINLTGTAPWTIRYRVNGASETTVNNIASSPYTLVVSNAMEPLASGGPDDYVFNVSYIRDATGSTGIRYFDSTATITLLESPNPVISGNTTVAINENNVIYRIPFVPGRTYLWSYSGTAGTTHNGLLTNDTLNMHWGSVAGTGWVRVTETVTAGGCDVTTTNYGVTITDIPNPQVTGPAPVCLNDTMTYRTSRVGTHTYLWTLPSGGGSIVGDDDLDSVMIRWTSAGDYHVMVQETGSVTEDDTLDVTVNPLPPDNNTVNGDGICAGDTANIVVETAPAGITYQLYHVSADTAVGSPVSSGLGGNVTLQAAPLVTTEYYILAANEYGCDIRLLNTATVTVDDPPSANAGSDEQICSGNSFDLATGTIPPTASDYSSVAWTRSGTGSFDNASALQPVYTPSAADRTTGFVYLILTANGNGACAADVDTMLLVINAIPSITLGANPYVCRGDTLAGLTYSATSGGANLYSIDFNIAAEGQGFVDVTDAVLPVSPIAVIVPATAIADDYDGTLTVTNSITNCISGTYNISVTVNELPSPSITGDTNVCETCSENYTTGASGNTMLWTVSGGSINSGQGTASIQVTWDALDPVGTLSAPATVEITETISATGCQSTVIRNITVHRVPVTGPQHHIDNDIFN